MITLLTNDLRSTFVGLAREWLSVLSRGEYKRASEMIDSANAYGVRWGRWNSSRATWCVSACYADGDLSADQVSQVSAAFLSRRKFLAELMAGATLISPLAVAVEHSSTPRIGVLVPSLTNSPLEGGIAREAM